MKSGVGWTSDPGARMWLVEEGERRPYYMVRGVDASGPFVALHDCRPVDRWPQLGTFVIAFPTRQELERWIAASDLP